MKTGRNEPCSCGSGKKSKQCCQAATPAARSGRIGTIVAVIVAIVAVALIVKTRMAPDEAPAPVATSAAAAPAPGSAPAPAAPATPDSTPAAIPGSAQPPGPAPAGKVWSREHGHWHDKPVSNEWVSVTPQKTVPLNKPGTGLPVNMPQPPGPAPAGKVWAPEHGHWHDAATGQAVKQELPKEVASQMKQPGVPADMKNYVWSEEHKHWHRKDATGEHATATILPPGTTTAPAPPNPQR